MQNLSQHWKNIKDQTIYSQIWNKYCEFFLKLINKNIYDIEFDQSLEIKFCKFYQDPQHADSNNIDLMAINATLKYFEDKEEIKFFEFLNDDSFVKFDNYKRLNFYLTKSGLRRATLIYNKLKELWQDYEFGEIRQDYEKYYGTEHYYFNISKKSTINEYNIYGELFLEKDINNIIKRINDGVKEGYQKIQICEIYDKPEKFKDSADYLSFEESKLKVKNFDLTSNLRARILIKKLKSLYPDFTFYYRKELERDYGCDGVRSDPNEYKFDKKADFYQIFMQEKFI